MRNLWLLTLVAVMGTTLLCALGFWQISRGHEKQALLDQWQSGLQSSPLSNDLLKQDPLPNRYSPVKLTGTFINEQTFLLDNKINNGRVGYHVITPFLISPTQILLVDRGWIPLVGNRDNIPQIPPILGQVTIEGYLDFAYRNPLIKHMIENDESQWPLRIQHVDLDALQGFFKETLFPMLVKFREHKLKVESVNGFTPERHYAYAFQWFSLALTLCGLSIWFYCRRIRPQ